MPTILGVKFIFGGGGVKPWENKAEKFATKFAIKFRLRSSPVNFPKIREAKIQKSPKIRTAEPWDQHWREAGQCP